MRIRTIKPEFWTNEKLSDLPEGTHYFAAALLNYADDEGYFNAHPGLIKAALYPLREPSLSIHRMLSELSVIDYIRLTEGSDGRMYGWIVSFKEHQRTNRPSKSKIKALADFSEPSLNAHGVLTDGTGNGERGTGNKEQGTGQQPARPPASVREGGAPAGAEAPAAASPGQALGPGQAPREASVSNPPGREESADASGKLSADREPNEEQLRNLRTVTRRWRELVGGIQTSPAESHDLREALIEFGLRRTLEAVECVAGWPKGRTARQVLRVAREGVGRPLSDVVGTLEEDAEEAAQWAKARRFREEMEAGAEDPEADAFLAQVKASATNLPLGEK